MSGVSPWRSARSGGSRIYLVGSDDVTRNSENTANDTVEFQHGVIVVPGGNGAVRGTIFEVWSLWEYTNSAGTKTFTERINGTSSGSGTATTNASYGQRQPFHVLDPNTLAVINSFGSPGGGANGSLLLQVAVPSLANNGFSLSLTSKWSAAVAGEFIRLKHAKIIQVNP